MRLANGNAQTLGGRGELQGVFVGVHALGEEDAPAFEAFGHELGGKLVGAAVAGFVPVVGDQHALDAVFLEGGEMVGGEALHAVGCRDVAIAGAPEGERVDERFAQDDFFAGLQGFDVPDAGMGAWQVEVFGGAGAQFVADLAAVEVLYLIVFVEDGDDQGAGQVFVAAGFAHHAQAFEAGAHFGAGLAALVGEAQPQGAVSVAEFEAVDDFRVVDAARLQVLKRFGAGFQGLVVVVGDLAQGFHVVGVEGHGGGQGAHGAVLDGVGGAGRGMSG